jgi:hypothetical protein
MESFGPYPALSVSHSALRDLEECPRRYYWRTWGSWLGWSVDIDHPAWLPYRLKNLAGVRQQIGILVAEAARDVVRAVLNGEEPPSHEELMLRCWKHLLELRARPVHEFRADPKRRPMLRTIFHGDAQGFEDEWGDAYEHLRRCLANLLDSDLLVDLAKCEPRHVLVCDSLSSIEIDLGGGDRVTMWAAPDIAFWATSSPEARLTVLDWKTGSATEVEQQLALYAIYICHRWQIPFEPDRFVGRVVSLGAPYRDREYIITQDDISAALHRMRAGVREIRSYEADAQTREPVERGLLPMTEDVRLCGKCGYAALCEPLRDRPRGAPDDDGLFAEAGSHSRARGRR